MTPEEALNLAKFENQCTCGGYAYDMNGRNEEQPHMPWCPRFAEHAEWGAPHYMLAAFIKQVCGFAKPAEQPSRSKAARSAPRSYG